jgi:hypothetical protein
MKSYLASCFVAVAIICWPTIILAQSNSDPSSASELAGSHGWKYETDQPPSNPHTTDANTTAVAQKADNATKESTSTPWVISNQVALKPGYFSIPVRTVCARTTATPVSAPIAVTKSAAIGVYRFCCSGA